MAKSRSSVGSWFVVALVVLGISQCFKAPSVTTSSNSASQQPTVTTTQIPRAAAPATSPSPDGTAPPTAVPANAPLRYVSASTLNLRAGPTTAANIIGKLPKGSAIRVIGQESDWLFVDTGSSQGWVSGAYTSANLPSPSTPPSVSQPAPAPSFNRGEIVQQIIERSLRSYSGNCPCPYNRMANGRSCGGNSAYSKPGGRSPICYPEQITDAMIAAFFRR